MLYVENVLDKFYALSYPLFVSLDPPPSALEHGAASNLHTTNQSKASNSDNQLISEQFWGWAERPDTTSVQGRYQVASDKEACFRSTSATRYLKNSLEIKVFIIFWQLNDWQLKGAFYA